MDNQAAIKNFQEYVRIKSVQPNPDYSSCVEWLRRQADEIGTEFFVKEYVSGKPVILLTIKGQNPELQSILLNSHMDVVPVFTEHWKYNPFDAFIDNDGNIYGRGTQDMKSVGVQYLEALKYLKRQNVIFLRTVHILFVPDEEIGGENGMSKFVQSEEFKTLNVGFVLDEGIASESEKILVFYAERQAYWVLVNCPGNPGHGSQFLPNTAGDKVSKVVDKFLSFRENEEKRLKGDSSLKLGDVITINLTLLKGGIQFNVVPSEFFVGFDIRVPPAVSDEEIKEKIKSWCLEAGEGVTYEFFQEGVSQHIMCVEDGKNKWWDAFLKACKTHNIELEKAVFPACTDSRYIRHVGIPALGFSPMNHTPLLLHDHNEFLNKDVYLKGIEIYTTIIKEIANLED